LVTSASFFVAWAQASGAEKMIAARTTAGNTDRSLIISPLFHSDTHPEDKKVKRQNQVNREIFNSGRFGASTDEDLEVLRPGKYPAHMRKKEDCGED
jgi:hypothetical protein